MTTAPKDAWVYRLCEEFAEYPRISALDPDGVEIRSAYSLTATRYGSSTSPGRSQT